MGELIPIHAHRTFTQENAEAILPVIRRITERASVKMIDLKEQLQWVPRDEPLYERLHTQMEDLAHRWAVRIAQLGCEPKGIWVVNFDTGNGWFSWRHGDESLVFFDSCESIDAPLPAITSDGLPLEL